MNLSIDQVSSKWIMKLLEADSQPEVIFKLAPHLIPKQVTKPDHFSIMSVCYAVTLLSNQTAIAIRTAVKKNLFPPEALATAWFIQRIYIL